MLSISLVSTSTFCSRSFRRCSRSSAGFAEGSSAKAGRERRLPKKRKRLIEAAPRGLV
jgi:hypothetical protein